jgi:type IV pilus assembly protein PilO
MALVPDNPRQRNALILGILAAAGFYFFWSWWYSPMSTEVGEMTARLEQLDTENRRAQILATRGGEELTERLALYERHVTQLEALIPQSEEVSALLNDVSRVARETGAEMASLRPEADQLGEFYTKESYSVEVYGEFHDIGRFLAAIASLPRIITPVNLELTRFQGARSALDMDLEQPVTATLQIQTYILPTPVAANPDEGGQGQQGGGS